MVLITQKSDLLIKIPYHKIIQLQKGLRRQVLPRLGERTFGHPTDIKFRILRLFEEGIHFPLQSCFSHSKYTDYQITERQRSVPGEGPFPAVLMTAFKIFIFIDMVVYLFRQLNSKVSAFVLDQG